MASSCCLWILCRFCWRCSIFAGLVTQGPLGSIPLSPTAPALVDTVKSGISSTLLQNGGQEHHAIIIEALGRCGSGARDFCLGAGISKPSIYPAMGWAETAKGELFLEIVASDVFVNCIHLDQPIPPFVTGKSLADLPLHEV